MCWRQERGGIWFPGPEDPRIAHARDELLEVLAGIGRSIPGDAWVLAQRVHYLGEAGRWGEARTLAEACGLPDPWPCHALAGLALHRSGWYEAADSAFRRALVDMPPEQARRWIDPTPLVGGAGRRVLDEAEERGPEAWREAVRRVWALSDPLRLVDGNDRWTEHLARHASVLFREDAANPHGLSWGSDLEELLVRYGPEVGWEKTPPRPGALPGTGSVVGHEAPESRTYVPSDEILRDPASAAPDAWRAELAYAPSAYAPAAAPVLLPMDAVVAVLPRGDRALLVASCALPPDTTRARRQGRRPPFEPLPAFEGRASRVGLFVEGIDAEPVARADGPGPDGVLALEVPSGRYWISVEAWDPAQGRAGRTRRGLVVGALPPDVAALSDLLVLAPGPEPSDLAQALPRVRPRAVVEHGASVVVAWEVTGMGWRPEELRYHLTLEGAGSGLLRRAGEWLGLVGPDRPLALVWSEAGPEAPGPAFRSVTLQLPDVEPGEYRLTLRLATRGRGDLVAVRRLRVVEASSPVGARR